jgi:hypothetical protein
MPNCNSAMAGFATVVALIFRALIFRALMSEQPRPDREKVPVAGIIAGDWIVAHDEDQGEAVQLLWRTGHRAPSGELGWSLKTSAGIRHFDRDEWVYRVTSTEHPVVLDIVDAVDAEVSLEAVHALVLAVGDKDPAWGAWLGMAAAIGLLNGVFFGALAGFITKAHVLDDVDQHATTVVEAERAHRSDIQHRGDPET